VIEQHARVARNKQGQFAPKANKENFLPTFEAQNKRLVPQLNQMPSTIERGMWTNEALETTMDVIERGTYSLRKANNSWDILMNSFFCHLNGKTKSMKMGLGSVLIREEDAIILHGH
jgi:hypothetical protein